METIDMNVVERIFGAFSRQERRRISKVCGAIDRALASSDRAFEAFGERVEGRPELSTTLLAVIELGRLEAHVADFGRLGEFWKAQWRQTSDPERAGLARRASEDLAKALSVIHPWLEELDAALIEQNRRGLPAHRLLPAAELKRAALRDQPPKRVISPDQRQDLLMALRRAVRPHGGVVNRAVFDGICNLAERGDPEALESLRRVREIVGLATCD